MYWMLYNLRLVAEKILIRNTPNGEYFYISALLLQFRQKKFAHNYYYANAKRIDIDILEAKTIMIMTDGSVCAYTYIIDTKTKSSKETKIEVFYVNGKSLGTY